MTQRIFHPVGQGAFYTETHNNDIKIVYDCGNWKKSKNSSKVVEQSFTKKDTIKILFISHFDFDHVSLISVLKNRVANIDFVVMPLLHDEEKRFLINFYQILGFDFIDLIQNPNSYFGENTKVIYIQKIEYNADIVSPDNVGIDTLANNSELKSGTPIMINKGIPFWVFIPYNLDYYQRNSDLENKLKKAGFDVNKLKTKTNYTIDEIVKDVSLSKPKGGKIFQQIYDSLNGKINKNSMILYSGPTRKIPGTRRINSIYCIPNLLYKRKISPFPVGCVYTGDGDLNLIKIEDIFKDYWRQIGTVQIPHHGDDSCFDYSFLNKDFLCPFSYGTKNNYGHPSSNVISKIIKYGGIPIPINENAMSTLIQTF